MPGAFVAGAFVMPPNIIMGDFNAHRPAWYSQTTSRYTREGKGYPNHRIPHKPRLPSPQSQCKLFTSSFFYSLPKKPNDLFKGLMI